MTKVIASSLRCQSYTPIPFWCALGCNHPGREWNNCVYLYDLEGLLQEIITFTSDDSRIVDQIPFSGYFWHWTTTFAIKHARLLDISIFVGNACAQFHLWNYYKLVSLLVNFCWSLCFPSLTICDVEWFQASTYSILTQKDTSHEIVALNMFEPLFFSGNQAAISASHPHFLLVGSQLLCLNHDFCWSNTFVFGWPPHFWLLGGSSHLIAS